MTLNAQNCDLPELLPLEPVELEAANRVIAECFAPTVHQMAENHVHNSANGRADLMISVFYDGDMNTGNNWENLENYQDDNPNTHDELDPVVYYSVVWTNYAWVVTYAFYHPRDYSGMAICCPDNHENDLEGAILVIDRSTNSVEGVYTMSHFDLINYNNATSLTEIYVDNGTHAVKADLGGLDCINGINPCDNCLGFNRPHITYTFAEDEESSVNTNDVLSDLFPLTRMLLEGEGKYTLEDIFGSQSNSLKKI